MRTLVYSRTFLSLFVLTALSLQLWGPLCAKAAHHRPLTDTSAHHTVQNTDRYDTEKGALAGYDSGLCQHQCAQVFVQTPQEAMAYYAPTSAYTDPPKDLTAGGIHRTIFQPPRSII